MRGFVIDQKEGGVDIIKGRSRVFAFTKNTTSVNVMEDDIEVMGLVGEAVMVIKDVQALPTACARNNTDRLGKRMKRRWVLTTISRKRPTDTAK